ncbi:MAG TPA: LysR family transcriptional regulator, partial [Polyangiaceae bacterium]|nr:LysR family transcriptional regulator [Polyangiaceae bacterium]
KVELLQCIMANSQELGDARWDDVRVFLATHRHKSFGAAGVRLAIDTSTVSRRVAAFEAALGVRLFERTREGLLPTRAAERVLAAAEAMEAAHARLSRDASDLDALAEGIVRISVAPGLADVFVAPSLVRLRAKHPKLEIELDASTQPRDLTRHEADLALRSTKPQGADLVVLKVATAVWVPAASPALAEHLRAVRAWDEVPWITWDRDLSSFGPARWVAANAHGATIALRTSHFSSQIAAARAGLGVVLAPLPYVGACKLARVASTKALAKTSTATPVDDLWLVGHRVLRDVPRVAAVWSFFAEELRAWARRMSR